MNIVLQHDRDHLTDIFQQTKTLAEQYLKQQDVLAPGKLIAEKPFEQLGEKGKGAHETLNYFQQHYAPYMCNSAGPRYFGFVTGGSTPASIAGDWLVSAYDQNACGNNDTIAPHIERQTIEFFKQLFKLDDAYFGSFVTGATMSNFVGLALGRQWLGEQQGVDISNDGLSGLTPLKIVSGTAHSSVFKALAMAGFGRKSLIKIDTLANREAIDLHALEHYLQTSKEQVIVVANAGTVNTVDFDDLEAIGKLKLKYNFWLHVDAAFGGFAACSEKYAHYLEGINYADSITIDAHKWLNVPYDAAMQFTRHQDLQLKVFQNSAAYLGDPLQSPDFFHYTPENSRRFRALPSWFTLTAYGKEGYRDIVERNCEAAHQLGAYLEKSAQFKLLALVRMNVVCFTLNQEDVTLQQILSFLSIVRDDGQVFFTQTVYKGTPAIRAAISNWQTEHSDIEIACKALKRAIDKQKTEPALT